MKSIILHIKEWLKRSAGMTILLFSLLQPQPQQYQTVVYNDESSLPSNLTKEIIQDSRGFIWIASDGGLARFDGKQFTEYNRNLPSTYVKNLFLTRLGKLLVVTDLGICSMLYNGFEPEISVAIPGGTHPSDSTLFYPKQIYEDRRGTLWISEPNAVVEYRDNRIHRYYFDEQYRADSYVRSFHFFEHPVLGLLAVSERGYLFSFDRTKQRFNRLDVSNGGFLIDAVIRSHRGEMIAGGSTGIYTLQTDSGLNRLRWQTIQLLPTVSSLAEDDRGQLIVGTWQNGVHIIDPSLKSESKVPSLPFAVINGVFIGNGGELWISSDDGIALLRRTYVQPISLGNNNLYMMSVIQKGKEILATDGKHISRLLRSPERISVESVYENTESLMLSLAVSGDTMWVGYRDAFITKHTPSGIERIPVPSNNNRLIDYMAADSRGAIWFCQDGTTGIYRLNGSTAVYYDSSKGISSHINIIRQFPDGALYAAGVGTSYLYKYNESSDRFADISAAPLPGQSAELTVNDLCTNADGTVWLGTNNGIWMYRNGSLSRRSELEDLNSELVVSLAKDPGGNIWIGTDHGMFRFKNRELSHYMTSDGLTSMAMSPRCMLADDSGMVWIGTAHGMCSIDAHSSGFDRTPPPILVRCSINDIPVDITDAGAEFRNGSYLSVRAVSLTFPAEKILYRMRLLGSGDEWSKPLPDNEFIIPQLNEGTYTLQVTAQQTGLAESAPAEYTFRIISPWYRQWWALTSYALVVILSVWILRKLRSSRVEQKHLKQDLARSEKELRELFESVEDVFLQTDHQGMITEITPSIEKHSGYSRSELIGKPSSLFFNDPIELQQFRRNIARDKQVVDFGLRLRTKSGELVIVSLNAQLVKQSDGKNFVMKGSIRDITRRTLSEDKLASLALQRKTLLDVTKKIITAQSEEDVARLIADTFDGMIEHDMVSLYRVDHELRILRPSIIRGVRQTADELEEWTVPIGRGVLGAVIESGIGELVNDAHLDPRAVYPVGVLPVEEQLIVVPVRSRNRAWGAVCINRLSGKHFTEEEFEIVQFLASYASLSLDNIKMMEEVRSASERLEQQQQFINQILDTTPNLISVKDIDGNVRLVNQAFSDLLGITKEELIAKNNLSSFDHSHHMEETIAIDRQVIEQQHDALMEEEFLDTRGELHTYLTVKKPLIDASGAKLVLGISSDITYQKRAEEELRSALQQERDLNDLKSRFVSMVSHEFRTPLATILSSMELIERYGQKKSEANEEKIKTHYVRIRDGIDRMNGLLDDVLMIGRADAGRMEFKPEALDINAMCEQLLEELNALVARHHQRIEFHSAPDVGTAPVDAKLLRHILTNLITNGAKYSPPNSTITLSVRRDDASIIFEVKDSGIGIPEEDMPGLFQSFHRAGNVGNIPGTGLGLTIVKRCIDLHNGSVSVNSVVNAGTTFTVKVPSTQTT
ncbi:MAG: PAS domain S-box protein [Bacteroidota bacterium]